MNDKDGASHSLKNKTILLVNTGYIKKRFILQRLKKLGLTTVVLHREKNWAAPYVDHWIIADTYNHEVALRSVENFLVHNPKVKIDGVITFWEDDVLLTAKIVDKFGFIGIPFRIAKQARNKYLFREFCKANGLPTPQHFLVKNQKDLDFVVKNFTFPIVIKPAYGSSSAFVIKVEEEKDLPETFSFVKRTISKNVESALSDGLDIFVEEYIDGDEVDIDLLLQNGKVKFYSISDNFSKERDIFFVDSGQAIPSSLPDKEQLALYEMAEEVLEKLGVQNGCIHFEAKSTKSGPMPIEVNLRMGGDYVYSYIKDAWGVDLIEMAVKISTGEYIKIKKPETPKKYIVGWDLHSKESGILAELNISDKVKKKPYVEEIHIYKEIGDPILVPPEGYEYLGWITVSGDNILDARDNLEKILDLISYKVVKFDAESALGRTARKSRFSAAVLNKNLLAHAAKVARIRKLSHKDQKKLHIGIACNLYYGSSDPIEKEFTTTAVSVKKALESLGYRVSVFDFNDPYEALQKLRKNNIDMVFNLGEQIHNSSFFKSHIASLLDLSQIPYTGSSSATLSMSLDKIRVKKLLYYHDIPTPRWDYAYEMDDEIDKDLRYPLIVKPATTDNSIGISNNSVVTNKKKLLNELEKVIVGMRQPALIEEYIEGDEFDVSILGTDETDLQVLPLTRSIFKNLPDKYWHIYSYEAKWSGKAVFDKIIVQQPPKNLSRKLTSLITEIALDTYTIMDCFDYGQVEIRVDQNNNPYVIELNPNPLLSKNESIVNAAKFIGMDFGGLLEEIIRLAVSRYQRKTTASFQF